MGNHHSGVISPSITFIESNQPPIVNDVDPLKDWDSFNAYIM